MCKRPWVYVVGLTGGIASGKSTVSSTLARLGGIIIDADVISHQVTQPGSPGLRQIAKAFGSEVISTDGSLDRKALGRIIFRDEDARKRLEAIIHPLVFEEIEKSLQRLSHNGQLQGEIQMAVLDVPLLFETGADKYADEVWVVWVERPTQEERLMKRDGYARDEAALRIDAQMPLWEKAGRATHIVNNQGDVEDTENQVTVLWRNLERTLAERSRNVRLGQSLDTRVEGSNLPSKTDNSLVVEATHETFGALVGSREVAIVDFWAPWCGPCRSFAPVFQSIAEKTDSTHPGKVSFIKVNVDNEGALAETYGITMIPTVIAFSGKAEVQRYGGPRTPEDFLRWVEELLSGGAR